MNNNITNKESIVTINFYSIDLNLSAKRGELYNQTDESILTRKQPETLTRDFILIFSDKKNSIEEQNVHIAQYYFEKRKRHITKRARPIRFVYISTTKKPTESKIKKMQLLLSEEYKIHCFQYYCYQNRHNRKYETYLALDFQNKKTGKVFDFKKTEFDKLKKIIIISFQSHQSHTSNHTNNYQTPTQTPEQISTQTQTQTQKTIQIRRIEIHTQKL